MTAALAGGEGSVGGRWIMALVNRLVSRCSGEKSVSASQGSHVCTGAKTGGKSSRSEAAAAALIALLERRTRWTR